jgi:hypothetical protein
MLSQRSGRSTRHDDVMSSFCASRPRWLPAVQVPDSVAATSSPDEFQQLALDRWENEGGRASRPPVVAVRRAPVPHVE